MRPDVSRRADSQGRAFDRTNPASYEESAEREIWEQGQWDRRPGSPRATENRGGVGFHLALVDDDCFELVPGSHKTFRTEREKEAMLHYNGLGEGNKFGLTKESPLCARSDIPPPLSGPSPALRAERWADGRGRPGGIRAVLKAGQTMFWYATLRRALII